MGVPGPEQNYHSRNQRNVRIVVAPAWCECRTESACLASAPSGCRDVQTGQGGPWWVWLRELEALHIVCARCRCWLTSFFRSGLEVQATNRSVPRTCFLGLWKRPSCHFIRGLLRRRLSWEPHSCSPRSEPSEPVCLGMSVALSVLLFITLGLFTLSNSGKFFKRQNLLNFKLFRLRMQSF